MLYEIYRKVDNKKRRKVFYVQKATQGKLRKKNNVRMESCKVLVDMHYEKLMLLIEKHSFWESIKKTLKFFRRMWLSVVALGMSLEDGVKFLHLEDEENPGLQLFIAKQCDENLKLTESILKEAVKNDSTGLICTVNTDKLTNPLANQKQNKDE